MSSPESDPTCSTISRLRHEPLLGTGPRADVWLLLTYAGPLGARAFEESDLPAPVKQHLTAALERIPHARLQLMSPNPDQGEGRIEFVVVHGQEVDPFYFRFELTSYEELLDLELDAILNADSGPSSEALQEPFYLVCTNGRRDPCCAEYGVPLFQAFHSVLGQRVRQSSHIGGHRFAANVLLFPHGLSYGRIRPDQLDEFLSAGQQGRMLLDNLRGRACYPRVVQAAEALLRQAVGNEELTAYRLLNERQIAEGRWEIEFEHPGSGELHQLDVESFTSADQERVSCWSDKLAPVTSYELRSHQVGS